MNVRNILYACIVLILLSSCSTSESGISIPEDISKENYEIFVKSYEMYEKRVKQHNGTFVDTNGNLIEFESGLFGDSDIMEVYWEHMKKVEAGKKGILTDKEIQLIENFTSLSTLKTFDYYTEDMKQSAINTNPEYADPIQAAIDIEEKIIRTLGLDKESVTASLQLEQQTADKNEVIEEKPEREKAEEVAEVEVDVGNIQEYEPQYMSIAEWETCLHSEVYSLEECINIDQYYADGDGLAEIENDLGVNPNVEYDPELSSAVQEYVVNIVNDLTIIENMSTDAHTAVTNIEIYGTSFSNDDITLESNSEEKIESALEIVKMALDDLVEQSAPRDTEYYSLEVELQQFVHQYQSAFDDLENAMETEDRALMSTAGSELYDLNYRIKDLHVKLAKEIVANRYSEYNAMLHIWSQGQNYQTGDSGHVTIPSGMKMQFFRNGIDFAQDLLDY